MNQIIFEEPPFRDRIVTEIGEPPAGAIYTFGDKTYVPSKVSLTYPLIAHEETHTWQQGDTPDEWWDRYFADKEFRLDQEIEAYTNQIIAVRARSRDKFTRGGALSTAAYTLSHRMYGNLIGFSDAWKLLYETSR